jgi:hypothetical protein
MPLSKNLLRTNQQVQRSASTTPLSASSICSPQPDQVAFLQISQVTFEHMGWLLYIVWIYRGGPRRDRTDDPRIKSPLLYRLS